MGSRRFELLTSAMSRRRHSQLDHGPAPVKECALKVGERSIKEFCSSNQYRELAPVTHQQVHAPGAYTVLFGVDIDV